MRVLAILVVLALAAGCGGGGSESPTCEPGTGYVGTKTYPGGTLACCYVTATGNWVISTCAAKICTVAVQEESSSGGCSTLRELSANGDACLEMSWCSR